MALQTALTNDQLAAIRSGAYQTMPFVCLVPNDVVVKFQPSAAPTSDVFAEISVGAVASGNMANIREGQSVIISSTSNYAVSETMRTRVRKVDGTSVLYVGENSAELTTDHYVTVINTYEIQEKLRRSETYADWDVFYRALLPIETALPSAVVLSNDETEYLPVAVPQAMDVSATSSFTHLWESSNSSDIITDETTDAPTFALDAASFRWIRYTYTDSNGNTNYRVIPCWTVPKDYSSVISSGFVGGSGESASLAFDPVLGWTATIPAWSGISGVLNRTMCVIASDEWYGGDRQNMRTNIELVGYLQSETTQISASQDYGRVSETRYTIEGFGHQLARQNVSPVTIIRTSTPSAWDDIDSPTPGRMLAYRMTEYSTASTLMAIQLPPDDADFIGDDLTLSTEKMLDDLHIIAAGINAEIQFDVTGKLELCRDMNYLSNTTRNTAPVVATFTPADFVGQYTIEYEYGRTTAQATITGGAFNTTTDEYLLYEAVAPAEARYSEGDPLELSNQVLETDVTPVDSMVELRQRAANFLAANNPTWTLRTALKDGWHFLVPDVGAWFKFSISATDTARGRSFGIADRWTLIQIDTASNALTGVREVNAVFRHETQFTGASVRVSPIANDPDADFDLAPAAFPSLAGGDLGLTGGFYYDTHDPQPPSEPDPVGANCELGGFRPKAGTGYETTNSALNGEWITYVVRGSGVLVPATSETKTVNSTTNPFSGGGATGFNVTTGEVITFAASGTWSYNGTVPPFSANGNGYSVEPDQSYHIAPSYQSGALIGKIGAGGSWFLIGSSKTITMTATGELYMVMNDQNHYTDNVGSLSVSVASANTETRGDAFYYSVNNGAWEAYDDGEGLLIEGFQPASIPPYNPAHEYQGAFTSTSGPIQYGFESPYDSSDLGNWSIQIITCFNGLA